MQVVGYGVRNLEGERMLEMVSALDMKVFHTCFKKHTHQELPESN